MNTKLAYDISITDCINYSSHCIEPLSKSLLDMISLPTCLMASQTVDQGRSQGSKPKQLCEHTENSFQNYSLVNIHLFTLFLPCFELFRQHSEMTSLSLLQPEWIQEKFGEHSNLCQLISLKECFLKLPSRVLFTPAVLCNLCFV